MQSLEIPYLLFLVNKSTGTKLPLNNGKSYSQVQAEHLASGLNLGFEGGEFEVRALPQDVSLN